MHEIQIFIGKNQLYINSNDRSASTQLPIDVDALLLAPCSLLLLSSSTKLGNLNATDVYGEAPLNFGNIDLYIILPPHAKDFPSLYISLEESWERF